MTEETSYLHRPCPACGGGKVAPRWKMASTPPAETQPFDELRSSWRGFFKDRKIFFSYVPCADCGQVYCPRYFTPAQLGRLYGEMDDNTGGLDESILARAQRGYWERVAPFAKLPRGAYVELGPDIGLFTREAREETAFDHFWMVEPNRVVHPVLDQVLADKPHTLLDALEQIDKIPDGSVSLVAAIHVLDHLMEPQKLLAELAHKLVRGGVVLAVTHSQTSLAARVFGERWPAYCLQHPQLYSPQTLARSFRDAGLDGVRIERTANYFPADYLLRHFFFAARLGSIRVPLPDSWVLRLKLGNIAALGRKP